MTTYSKRTSHKLKIKDESGEVLRVYTIHPFSARTTAKEGFKLLKKVLPAIGAAQDSRGNEDNVVLGMDTTFQQAFSMLEQDLSEEHFEDLCDKLLGGVKFEGEFIDVEDHFDEYPDDFLEVLLFAGEKSFYDFFTKNSIVRSKILPMIEKYLPKSLVPSKKTDGNENESDT